MERIFYALGGLVLLSGVTLTALAPTDLMASRDAFFARLGILGPSVISGCLLIAIGYVIQLLKAIRDHLVPQAASGSLLSPLTGAVTGAVVSAGSLAGKAVGNVAVDAASTVKETGAKAVDAGVNAIGAGTAAVIAGGAAIGAVAASVLHTEAEAETAPAEPIEPPAAELPAAPAPQADAVPDLTSYLDSLLNPVSVAAPEPVAIQIEEPAIETPKVGAHAFDSDDFTFDLSDLTPSGAIDEPVEAPIHFDDDALSRAMAEALNTQDALSAPETTEELSAEAPVPSMATPVLDAEDAQRAPTVEEYLGRSEPAPEAETIEAPRTVVREGQFAGRRYRMFEDGSLEIDTEQSTIKFASLDEFRAFVSAASTKG